MTKAGAYHSEQDYLDWMARMGIEPEDMAMASNDLEWQDFVRTKLTNLLGEPDSYPGSQSLAAFQNRMQAIMELSAQYVDQFSFTAEETTTSLGNTVVRFRDRSTGQFISADAAAENAATVVSLGEDLIP